MNVGAFLNTLAITEGTGEINNETGETIEFYQEDKLIRHLVIHCLLGNANPFPFITAEHFSNTFLKYIFSFMDQYFKDGVRLSLKSMQHDNMSKEAIDYISSLNSDNLILNELIAQTIAYDVDDAYRLRVLRQKTEEFLFKIKEGRFYETFKSFETYKSEIDVLSHSPLAHKTEYNLDEMLDDFLISYDQKKKPFFSTGLTNLDAQIGGFKRGDLVIMGGRPGMGKTGLALNFACNLLNQGLNVLYLNYEMTKEQTMARILALYGFVESLSGTTLTELSFQKTEKNEVEKIINAIKAKKLNLISNFDTTITANNLAQYAKKKAKELLRNGKTLDCIFIDYLQIMPKENNKNYNQNQALGDMTGRLKRLAKELDVPVVLLSQLNREIEKEKNINDKKPSMAHLRDSGSIEQDADIVMFPFRPSYYEKKEKHKKYREDYMEIIIDKNRQGVTGIVKAYCNMAKNFICDTDQDDDGLTLYGKQSS
jgi:replicative DNA helicase